MAFPYEDLKYYDTTDSMKSKNTENISFQDSHYSTGIAELGIRSTHVQTRTTIWKVL